MTDHPLDSAYPPLDGRTIAYGFLSYLYSASPAKAGVQSFGYCGAVNRNIALVKTEPTPEILTVWHWFPAFAGNAGKNVLSKPTCDCPPHKGGVVEANPKAAP